MAPHHDYFIDKATAGRSYEYPGSHKLYPFTGHATRYTAILGEF